MHGLHFKVSFPCAVSLIAWKYVGLGNVQWTGSEMCSVLIKFKETLIYSGCWNNRIHVISLILMESIWDEYCNWLEGCVISSFWSVKVCWGLPSPSLLALWPFKFDLDFPHNGCPFCYVQSSCCPSLYTHILQVWFNIIHPPLSRSFIFFSFLLFCHSNLHTLITITISGDLFFYKFLHLFLLSNNHLIQYSIYFYQYFPFLRH